MNKKVIQRKLIKTKRYGYKSSKRQKSPFIYGYYK